MDPSGDVAFWQGALRDPAEEIYGSIVDGIEQGAISVDLLYRDNEGEQRTLSRFSFIHQSADGASAADDGWWVSLAVHRSLDDR